MQSIKIVEVGPRDGFQNESAFIATQDKINIINKLGQSGLKNIEVTSFVSPKWIPQLADNIDVLNAIKLPNDVKTMALVPNIQGYKNAQNTNLDVICCFMSATQSHSKKNINKSIEEALSAIKELAQLAKDDNKIVRCYLSCCFFCPYEGEVDLTKIAQLLYEIDKLLIDEISIGDTIGYATPKHIKNLLQKLKGNIDFKKLALHLHDTYGMAIANAYAGIENGITIFDSSFGGLGGCPYAPGASGNVATEDLVYMLNTMGFDTGIDLAKLIETSIYAESILNKNLPSKFLIANKTKCINKEKV